MVPTAAAINNGNVANRMVRPSAGAPKNMAMPVFTSVFERTAMTIVRAATFRLSGFAVARFAIEREMASTSVRPAIAVSPSLPVNTWAASGVAPRAFPEPTAS